MQSRQAIPLHISSGANWEFFEFNITDGWESVGTPQFRMDPSCRVRNGANEYLYVNGVMVDNTISTKLLGGQSLQTRCMHWQAGRRVSAVLEWQNRRNGNVECRPRPILGQLCYQNQKPGSRSSCSPTKIIQHGLIHEK